MAKKITVTGKPARHVEVTGKGQRRIEHADFAVALGAEAVDQEHSQGLDPLALASLGGDLVKRLRSSGGRPALADASEFCRVPLSTEDVAALEKVGMEIERETGARPSLGQLASVMIRAHLDALKHAVRQAAATSETPPAGSPEPALSVALVEELIEKRLRPVKDELQKLAHGGAAK